MKKTIAIFLCVFMLTMLCAGCGAAKSDSGSSYNKSSPMSSPGSILSEEMGIYAFEPAASAVYRHDTSMSSAFTGETGALSVDSDNAGQLSSTSGGNSFAEKIIYSAYAIIETVEFDATIENVYVLMDIYGAFVENSNVGGRNYAQSYHGWQTYRTAYFTLRVPVASLKNMVKSLDTLGNVTSTNSDSQNITAQFYDTESRLSSYRTQEERLLAMLAKAETVTDMIEIESRLADVRYNIESMTTTLRNWQNQVDYSTLSLSISEVEKFTEYTPIQRTYWQQVSDGFSGTLKSVGEFFKDLFKWFVVNIPVIVLLAVLVIAAVIIIRRLAWRRRNRMRSYFESQQANGYPDPAASGYSSGAGQQQYTYPGPSASGTPVNGQQPPVHPGQSAPEAGDLTRSYPVNQSPAPDSGAEERREE